VSCGLGGLATTHPAGRLTAVERVLQAENECKSVVQNLKPARIEASVSSALGPEPIVRVVLQVGVDTCSTSYHVGEVVGLLV
jgi:hypothetical protein